MNNQLQPRGLTSEPPAHNMPPTTFDGYYGSDTSGSFNLADYWHILRKRRWWAIGFFLLIVSLVGVYTFLQTPIYRASVVLQILQDNPSTFGGSSVDPFSSMQLDIAGKFYETQYKLLSSRPLALKIIDSLKLAENPEFKISPEKAATLTPEQIRDAMAQTLLSSLQVIPVKNTYLVEVAYMSPDKELAREIVNDVYREYLRFSMDTRQQSYAMIREWLGKELGNLAGKVETSQRSMYQYGREKNFLPLEGDDNVTVKKFVELNRLLTTAESDRMTKEAQFNQMREKGAEAPAVINNPLVMELRKAVIAQEAKVSSAKKIFGKNYPKLESETANLAELRSRLQAELQRTKTGIKADYEIALRAEKFLKGEFDRQKGNVEKWQDDLVQHEILKRDLQTNEELYKGLLARMKEANVASTMMPSSSAIIESAVLPINPSSPKKVRNMALAVMLGLFGGIGLAFTMERLDNSIKTPEELERLIRVPALGMVPMISLNGKGDQGSYQSVALACFEEPKSMVGDAIGHVSTALMLSLSERPPVGIMVTSPNPGDGKSSISINLASSLAMIGKKVVLIDADMRRPVCHKAFGLPFQPGLSNFLAGSASLGEIIQTTKVPGLSFIAAGTVPPNPAQLLGSPMLQDLRQQLYQEFQHVIFDTPPIVSFSDGLIISSLLDGVLLVFKHHITSRDSGRLAVHLLHQVNANVFGVVLNMAKSDKVKYGGYYGYDNYYNKYYKDYQAD